MIALILLGLFACSQGQVDPSAQGLLHVSPPSHPLGDPSDDTGSEQVEPTTSWYLATWEGVCPDGEIMDFNLPVQKGVPVTSFLLVEDGYGFSAWVDAREGVVIWGTDGLADIRCSYSGWASDAYSVTRARVVWVYEG